MAQPKEERVVEIIVNGQKANASIKEMDAAAAVLWNQLRKLSADDPGRAKLVADYQAVKSKIAEVKAEVTGVSQSAGVMKQAFANAFALFTGGGILGIVQQVFGLGKAIFETTAKFQTYESVMTNALGDKSKAQQAMKDIQTMAAKTPFSVDELTGSFIKFINRGLNPSMTQMGKLADLAASQGKSFDQLTEAVLDAGGGEFERLKEFGIKASKSGDQVSLSFKGITQSVKNTPEAINGAIMAFGGMKGVAGSTAAISATLEGQLSNLGDTSDQLKLKMGEGLKPVFTAILTLLGRFIGWIGRFIDEAGPLKELFVEVGGIVREFYSEIADVLEGLGLFSDKTDTVKMAVEILKVALTLLLLPLKTLFLMAKGVTDVFIDWYNKSELLRGVLGGLGAMIVSVFTTIKDDALKILGGVGDILIGIFSLDKNKIVAGFKSALAGTADLALESGQKAADAFLKGYEANKGNHITRRVKVEAKETGADGGPQAGETLKSDTSSGDAAAEKKREAAEKKAQALRDKAAKLRLEALKELVKQEEALEDAHILTIADQRERERARINLDAKRKAALVVGTEQEITAQRVAINEERERKLQELSAKYQDQADKQDKEDFERQIAEEDAAEQLREEQLFARFEDALDTQERYDQGIYDAKHASLLAKLALEEAYAGKTSKLYLATNKELLALEKDHNKQVIADTEKREKAKREMQLLGVKTAGDVLQTTIDLLFQDEAARKKHHNLYTALSGAKLIMDGVQEVASIWRYAAENPANGFTGGVAGAVIGGVQTALAVARTAYGLTRLQEFSFAKGGRTGGGMMMDGSSASGGGTAVSPMGTLMEMSGMAIGSNGKLMDNSGFAVAGLVHEDEYVVPKWMRQDPQVVAVEQWLEAKRLRGYAEGGGTGGATLPAAAAAPATDGELTYAVLVQLLEQSKQQTAQLADVKSWQARLAVYLDLAELEAGQSERKQVQLENGIRK